MAQPWGATAAAVTPFPHAPVSACRHYPRALPCVVRSWGHSKAAPCTCAWKLLPCHPYLDPAAVLLHKYSQRLVDLGAATACMPVGLLCFLGRAALLMLHSGYGMTRQHTHTHMFCAGKCLSHGDLDLWRCWTDSDVHSPLHCCSGPHLSSCFLVMRYPCGRSPVGLPERQRLFLCLLTQRPQLRQLRHLSLSQHVPAGGICVNLLSKEGCVGAV